MRFFFTPVTDQSKVLYNQNQSYHNSQAEERKLSQGAKENAKVKTRKEFKVQHERLTGWYEIFGPITKRSKAKLNKSRTLKIALKQWITSNTQM